MAEPLTIAALFGAITAFRAAHPKAADVASQLGQAALMELAKNFESFLRSSGGSYVPDNQLVNAESLEISGQYVLCDYCRVVDDEDSTYWEITKKGNFKCEECGTKNDFVTCKNCGSVWFRRTKKWNYRCLGCDTKVDID